MTYISSQSLTMPMRSSVMQMQADMAQAQTEISTSKKADIGLSLGGQSGAAVALQNGIDQLNTYTNSNTLVATRLSTTATVLTTMLTSAQNMSKMLITALNSSTTTTPGTSAQNALQGLVGSLNASVGGQYVFGGIDTDTQPIASYTATSAAKTKADNAFQQYLSTNGYTAATLTAGQMQTFLNGPFSTLFNDANWGSDWSSASDQTMKTSISPSATLTTSVSANDGAFRKITQAYTMVAEFADAGLSSDASNALYQTASQLVSGGIQGLTNLSSGVGIAQATVDAANTQMSSQIDLLNASVDKLVGVDPAALSTKVTQLQTQLEASYELTSRLSKLSLVNYLNG